MSRPDENKMATRGIPEDSLRHAHEESLLA